MSRTYVIDIETTPRPGIMDTFYPQWAETKYPGKEGVELENMAALHAEFGMVCAVAYADAYGSAYPVVLTAATLDEEATLLDSLLSLLNKNGLVLVGHNIKGFDIPFLAKRYMAHTMYVPQALNVAGMKPWEVLHKDTMEMMRFGGGASMSLRSACLMLGIDDPKDACCGSDVADMFRKGQLDSIGTYCAKDVIAEREVFNRIVNSLGI